MTAAFFLGLATTMVMLGASATALSQVLFRNLSTITLIGGLVMVGFNVTSILGKGFRGVKLLDRPSATLARPYLYGGDLCVRLGRLCRPNPRSAADLAGNVGDRRPWDRVIVAVTRGKVTPLELLQGDQ